MPSLKEHPDELTLLRFVAGELPEFEGARLKRHLASCAPCRASLEKTRELDATLRRDAGAILGPGELPVEDPFRRRPVAPSRDWRGLKMGGSALAEAYANARRLAEPLEETLRAAVADDGGAGAALAALDLRGLPGRLALGGALDAASRHMGDAPRAWRRFAEEALRRLEPAGDAEALAEFAYPVDDLRGRAHVVAGWSRNWSAEFERAGDHLREAWSAFGRGGGSAQDFAAVEVHESQRRSFLERPAEALLLARRAAETFEELRLAVPLARARFAEGLALSYLGEDEEAIPRFTEALAPLADAHLWNAWASVLNNLGTSYLELGRWDDARRAYARALQRVDRRSHPGVHAFVRYNLGLIHFRMSEYAQAIPAFEDAASLFAGQGSTGDALVTLLHLVEALVRTGASAKAAERLREVERTAAEGESVDPSTLRAIEEALSGRDVDFEALARLRSQAEASIRARVRAR